MIPRLSLAHLPTPVEPLQRLSAALTGSSGLPSPRLYIKRDDQTGVAFGGNKVRKLEYVLAEAQANGARSVVTVGASTSNHCRMTAALAARLGLECTLVLSGEEPETPGGNLLLDYIFGANIVWTTRAERDQVLQSTFDRLWAEGKRPYKIPLGASTPTGALGYVHAAEELAAQGLDPDWIVIASSSAGTQAGLVAGVRQLKARWKVLGISIDFPASELEATVASLATEVSERLGWPTHFEQDEILVNDDYLGQGYGVMGQPEIEAIRLFGQNEGIVIGPVYTGRAGAALIDLVRKGFFKEGETVLFWHTGDGPTLFTEPYIHQLTASRLVPNQHPQHQSGG